MHCPRTVFPSEYDTGVLLSGSLGKDDIPLVSYKQEDEVCLARQPPGIFGLHKVHDNNETCFFHRNCIAEDTWGHSRNEGG